MEDKLHGTLVGIDGNAYSILGKFKRDARYAGWSPERIKQVMDDAKSGDYNHLLATIAHQYDMDEADA